jgi:hypothetical protein
MTKAERLARKLCRAAWDEAVDRGGNQLRGFMLTTITARAKAVDPKAVEQALQFAEERRWAEATPRGTFKLLEAGRQMLKAKG